LDISGEVALFMRGASLEDTGVIHSKRGKMYPPDTFPGTHIIENGDGVLVVYPESKPLQTKVTSMMMDFIQDSWSVVQLNGGE
jgi:hypothetical protein